MSHYLIFIPDAFGASQDNLSKIGLGALSRSGGPDWFECDRNPSDTRGMFCTWLTGNPDVDPALEYNPDNQRWVFSEDETFWLGIPLDRPPVPRELAHRNPIEGRNVEMADGMEWLIPQDEHLPMTYDRNEFRQWVGKPKPAYKSIADRCEAIRDAMFEALGINHLHRSEDLDPQNFSPTTQVFPVHDGLELLCDMMALNYRVTNEIANELGLFDKQSMMLALATALGIEDILSGRWESEDQYVSFDLA